MKKLHLRVKLSSWHYIRMKINRLLNTIYASKYLPLALNLIRQLQQNGEYKLNIIWVSYKELSSLTENTQYHLHPEFPFTKNVQEAHEN